MRFLIDENVPHLIVDWLNSRGHDCVYAAHLAVGASDEHWLAVAEAEQRIIITSDKDFGELIFRDNRNSHGIVLLRLFDLTIAARLLRVQEAWSVVEANPQHRFIVITSKRVRVRPLH